MVVSGSRHGTDGGQFRIVTGRGAFVSPWKNKARWSLFGLAGSAHLRELCHQAAASRSLSRPWRCSRSVTTAPRSPTPRAASLTSSRAWNGCTAEVLAGHLRSIVGGLTVEEIIGDRNRVAQEVKAASTDEMEKLGLVIDAFQIQEIKDVTGYIDNLAAPACCRCCRDAALPWPRPIRRRPRRSRRRTR